MWFCVRFKICLLCKLHSVVYRYIGYGYNGRLAGNGDSAVTDRSFPTWDD